MKPLDEELRSALRRLEPPPDFAKRVLARIEAGRHPKAGWGRARLTSWMASFRLPRVARLRWIAAGALACLLAVIGSVEYWRYRRARTEGEMARQQVILALHIASDKLNGALSEVKRVDRRQPPVRARANQ